MGLFSFALPPVAAAVAIGAAGVILFRNAHSAPWRSMDASGAFSAWCFSVIVLPLLWHFNVPVASGQTLHLLGMPLFVLMFGRQLALSGLALSVIAYTALHEGPWSNIGINMLLLAVLPAYCGELLMQATRRFLPHHLFVYLLGNGFFGASVMLATIGMASLAAHRLWVAQPIGVDTVAFMLLLAWGEAFLTGFLLTMFTVYRPQWVLTFSDELYLRNK